MSAVSPYYGMEKPWTPRLHRSIQKNLHCLVGQRQDCCPKEHSQLFLHFFYQWPAGQHLSYSFMIGDVSSLCGYSCFISPYPGGVELLQPGLSSGQPHHDVCTLQPSELTSHPGEHHGYSNNCSKLSLNPHDLACPGWPPSLVKDQQHHIVHFLPLPLVRSSLPVCVIIITLRNS